MSKNKFVPHIIAMNELFHYMEENPPIHKLCILHFKLQNEDINTTVDNQTKIEELIQTTVKILKQRLEIRSYKENWPQREKNLNDIFITIDHQFFPKQEDIIKYRESIKMYCPICKTKLKYSHRETVETLVEHVSDPNGTPSKKDLYSCTNTNCNGSKLAWLDGGEGPYGSYDIVRNSNFINGNNRPFNSYDRKHIAEKEKTIFSISISKFRLTFHIRPKANTNGIVNYFISSFNFKLWINNTLYQSGIHMFFFSLGQYFRPIVDNRQRQFKQHAERLNSWDKRWWSKLSFTIASFIFKKDKLAALSDK